MRKAIILIVLILTFVGGAFARCYYSSIAAGYWHSLGLKPGGGVWAWGSNQSGGIGDGTLTDRLTPVEVHDVGDSGFLGGVIQVSGGLEFSVALKSDGTVWAWGENKYGQLGNADSGGASHFVYDDSVDMMTPVQVVGPNDEGYLTDFIKIDATGFNVFAIKSDSTLWSWGENVFGELGDGTDTTRYTPVQVVGPPGIDYLTDVIEVSGGGWNTFALTADGYVWSWGENFFGQLGRATGTYDTRPGKVMGEGGSGYLTNIISIAAGSSHGLALTAGGTVWAWGLNDNGQLGNNDTSWSQRFPVQVLDSDSSGYLSDVVMIAGGNSHSVALKSDGTVWTWGENRQGELGTGDTVESRVPVQVVDSSGKGHLTDIIAISAGMCHTLALDRYGSVWGWGNNRDGQLGDGTSGPMDYYVATPVEVACEVVMPQATVVSPPNYGTSSCSDQGVEWLIEASDTIDPATILVYDGSSTFDTADARLTYTPIDVSAGRLEFVPDSPWASYDSVQFCLVAVEDITGLQLEDTVCVEFYIDMIPPMMTYISPDSTILVEDPAEIEIHHRDAGCGSKNTSWKLTVDGVEFGFADPGIATAADSIVVLSFSEAGVNLQDMDTVFVEFRVWDTPDICPPNETTFAWWFIPVVGIDEEKLPEDIELSVWPNPFNGACRIAAPEETEVEIFDINGRIVGAAYMPHVTQTARTRSTTPTVRELKWSPDEKLPSGIYLVRARFGGKEKIKRVIYLK